jgi:hypothetical protein
MHRRAAGEVFYVGMMTTTTVEQRENGKISKRAAAHVNQKKGPTTTGRVTRAGGTS